MNETAYKEWVEYHLKNDKSDYVRFCRHFRKRHGLTHDEFRAIRHRKVEEHDDGYDIHI